MSTWSFVLAPGGDITALVDVSSIVKTERLFTELRPNVNKVEFRALFNSSLFATLLSNDTVEVTITKDSVAYFAGVISPNHRTPIRDGQKYISMIAEDYTLSRLGKTITAPAAYAGYAVCTPSATSTSLVHAIATAAGVTLAASLPTISTTVPYVVALPDDKTTWGALLEGILFEFGYVYLFQADGTLAILPSVNTGTISTTGTLTTAPGSANIRGDLDIEKSPEKYDDIRIRYDLVELKTGIVLFQDTTGGSETSPCSIPLAAIGDADGKDYYPLTSKIGEVFSAWNNPDGFKVWVVTSAALDVTAETGIVADRSLTNYYRKCSFSYKNTAGAEKRITKLRITGNAYVVASQNVARTSIASAKKLLEITANYIFNVAAAESLAEKIAQYYKYSDLKYRAKSTDVFTLGQYVAVVDTVYSGLSTDCRVVGRVFRENASGVIEYELEGVDDFSAVTVDTEGDSVPSPDTVPGAIVAPSNNVTDVVFTESQNADGSVKVTAEWEYVQGTNPADAAFIYYKGSITGAPAAFDYASDMCGVKAMNADGTYSWSQDFPGSTGGTGGAPIRYRFGVVAARGALLHSGGAVTPTGWDDKTLVPVIQDIDFNLYDKSFTSYEGSGVFRRAVRVSGDGVRWLNAPDGGSEEEKARIKRLGKGSEYVLMDGRFSSNDDNCFWKFGEVVASALSSYPSVDIAWISPTEIRYVYSNGSVYEKVYNGSTWGAASLIASNAINPGYGFDIDGNLVLGFSDTSTNDLVVYKRSGGSWSSHSTVYNGSSGNSSRPRFCIYDNTLYIAYYNGVEGGAIEKYYSGGAWSSASVISASHGVDGYIVNLDGDRQIFYSQASTNYFASKTYNGSSWGSETTEISTAMTGACDVIKTIDNKIRVAFCRSSDSAIVASYYDGSSWSTPTTTGASSEWAALSQSDDGTLYLAYVNLADRYGHFGYLKRYAPIASYSTGTWTPRVYGTTTEGVGTYVTQYGYYSLIGNICYFYCYLQWSAHTGTGNIRIDGLPFDVKPGTFYLPITIAHHSLSLTAGNVVEGYLQPGAKIILPKQVPAGGGGAGDIPMDTAVTWMLISGFYFIA